MLDVQLVNIGDNGFFKIPKFKGLEKIVRFPDTETKRDSIPNSTVWIFNSHNHSYVPEILHNDAGCGMAAFIIEGDFELRHATDKIYNQLNGKNILGRGNHFVDVCSGNELSGGNNILLIHSDGKSIDTSVPQTIPEAKAKQQKAEYFRQELGYNLAKKIGAKCSIMGNWTHNSVDQEDGKIIYRKGVIKTTPEKIYVLPANLGEMVLFYIVDKENMPPCNSMPHATGRAGPRGDLKVTAEKAGLIRKVVYIPEKISNESLRSEYPSCYNDFKPIFNAMGKYIVEIDEAQILSYVGKI